jgi:hypothetical protein
VANTSLRLGNTDPELIRMYIKFLTDICGVRLEKIRYGLQLFNDSNQDKAINFWMKRLQVDRSSFMPTISIVAPQGKGTYKKRMSMGL